MSHAATFRALADTRVWFFRRLAERLPAGLGGRSSGDLLGRLVADVEALDGLYLRAIVPAVAALAVVLAAALRARRASRRSPCWSACRCCSRCCCRSLLAPGAARGAGEAAPAQGRLRAAVVDPLIGLEDIAGRQCRGAAPARRSHARRRRSPRPQRGWRGARRLGGAAGALLVQAALLGALAWGLAAGGAARSPLGGVVALFLAGGRRGADGRCCRAPAPRSPPPPPARAGCSRPPTRRAPVPEPPAPPRRRPPAGHAIRVEGVHFAWAAGPPAGLRRASTSTCPEGTRLAVLGPSGTGKSSLAALLLKLAAPRRRARITSAASTSPPCRPRRCGGASPA